MSRHGALFVGIDIGTSGVRAVAIDALGQVAAEAKDAMPPPQRDGSRITQDPSIWRSTVASVLEALCAQLPRERIVSIAVDGTSGTLLLTDAAGTPLTAGWMYNDASCVDEATRIGSIAPAASAAHGASSPLARLLQLQPQVRGARHVLHQADWIAGWLSGRFGIADENNVLKLGYDVVERCWPAWLDALAVDRSLLPTAVPPGTPIGRIEPAQAHRFGLNDDVAIVAGTTDGVAAFLATGAREVGDAVTSLGTTLVVKLLSDRPVFAPEYGIYSHRLGELWLPGGASNSGGAALLRFFTAEQMLALTPSLKPDQPTGLDYYPLPDRGERFPVNDPARRSCTDPRPADDGRFFQALLEGVAGVERLAFERIRALGAPAARRVYSVGGGARNLAWSRIRERVLGVPVLAPAQEEAAYGAALLARQGGVE